MFSFAPLFVFLLCLLHVAAVPQDWPRQMVMRYQGPIGAEPEEPKMISTRSRAFLPPRYRNLFGGGSSKVHEGSAFLPKTISDFTGKVGALRRQTFSWRPETASILGDGM